MREGQSVPRCSMQTSQHDLGSRIGHRNWDERPVRIVRISEADLKESLAELGAWVTGKSVCDHCGDVISKIVVGCRQFPSQPSRLAADDGSFRDPL